MTVGRDPNEAKLKRMKAHATELTMLDVLEQRRALEARVFELEGKLQDAEKETEAAKQAWRDDREETKRERNEAIKERDAALLRLDETATALRGFESLAAARWDEIKALERRLDSARAAFRAADNGSKNDWCDATKESWPVKSDKWLDLEEALFASLVEKLGHNSNG